MLKCSAAGTQVLSKDGYAAIATIEVGDEVWITGESAWKPVTKTWTVEEQNLYELTITNNSLAGKEQTIEATANHPFYVVGSGWIDTIFLQPCDTLVDKDQGFLEVVSIENLNKIETAYNLTVADFHT